MHITNGRIFIAIPYRDKDRAKRVPTARWDAGSGCWSFSLYQREALEFAFPEFKDEIQASIPKLKNTSVKTVKQDLTADILEFDFKRKPFAHQHKGMIDCVNHKQFALFWEMGCGKTKAIIDTFSFLKKTKRAETCLIVCPKTLLEIWEEEIKKDGYSTCTIISGNRKKRIKLLTSKHDYAIINYESLLAIGDNPLLEKYDMIVLDESTRIKNHKAKITRLVTKIFVDREYRYILSGTPITQGLIDIFTQYQFLNRDYLDCGNYYSFRNRYCIIERQQASHGFYQQIVGYKTNMLPRLKKMISKHSSQLKKEACLDLPEKIYEKRYVEMDKVVKEQYNHMKDELMLEISETEAITAPMVLTKIIRLQEIISGKYLQDQKHNNKLKEVATIIEDNPGEQVVVWARFRKSIALLEDMCKRRGWEYSIIHGDIEDRKEQIDRFQSGKSRVFIGQIQAGGEGITITASHIAIVYENTFSLKDRKQFEDRIHRPGQKTVCTYIDLIYKGTIDTQIMSALNSKQDISNYLVDSFLKGDYKLRRKKK